jgi:RIO-like serine/threonine protein kinase
VKNRNQILVRLGAKAAKSRAFRDSDEFFDEFVDALASLGGIYTKFLQGILLGYSVSRGKKISDKQLNVFEDNPDPNISLEYIQKHLGQHAARVSIAHATPIGVGSYSAVYEGLLDGDKKVVIKILKPNMHTDIKKDLKFLKRLARLLKIAGIRIATVDISQFYASFRKACLQEMKFLDESTFAAELYERYKNHASLVVPFTYTELCSKKIIVQEYVGGTSAKALMEMRLKDGHDVEDLLLNQYGTDLKEVLQVVTYETFYNFLSGRPFHGDLHPGNIRILPYNKIAILDFGIKAEPYRDTLVPAAINKLESDLKFMSGDLDLARLIEAHFRLYMSDLYASIDSLLSYFNQDKRKFFNLFVRSLGISIDTASPATKKKWVEQGPLVMLNDLLKGSDKSGIGVKIKDHSTQRAISTQFSLLKPFGMKSKDVLEPVYERIIRDIKQERPELFIEAKKLRPDIAFESIYNWIESISSTNPALAHKIRTMINLERLKNA